MIKWEEPPERGNWKGTALELQKRPGAWARICEPTTETKAMGIYKNIRRWGCQAVVRKLDEVGYGVWARWPGENPDESLPNEDGSRIIGS